jgi:hypothetical protein
MPRKHLPVPAAHALRGLLLLSTCAVAFFNGSLWSPIFDSVSYVLYLATRGYPMMNAARAYYATPIVIMVMTLLIAGIPAALYERLRGASTSTIGSLTIWLLAAVLLSLPTIMNATGDR